MNNADKFNILPVEVNTGLDLILLESRLKGLAGRLKEELLDKDPRIVLLATFIIKNGQLKSLMKQLDEEFDRLQSESETLIESPNANTPEVLQRRKEIADKINQLLNLKERANSIFDEMVIVDRINKIMPKEIIDEANSVAELIVRNVNETIKPDASLN